MPLTCTVDVLNAAHGRRMVLGRPSLQCFWIDSILHREQYQTPLLAKQLLWLRCVLQQLRGAIPTTKGAPNPSHSDVIDVVHLGVSTGWMSSTHCVLTAAKGFFRAQTGLRAEELISGLSEVPLEDGQLKAIEKHAVSAVAVSWLRVKYHRMSRPLLRITQATTVEIKARRESIFVRASTVRDANMWASGG